MPNLFPNIDPTTWEIDLESLQERDVASKGGGVQINAWDPVEQIFARGTWGLLPRPEYDAIEDHWHTNNDGHFDLYDFKLRKMRGLWVAVADGLSVTYTLPAKSVAGMLIKHNGVVAATQPTLLVGAGEDGEDEIQYTAGTKPASGVIITLDATDARQKIEVCYGNVRFAGRDVEADVDSVELEFIQRVLA